MLRLLSAFVIGLAALGCGANVSKTYESDVRFERCYSLDWGDVEPTLRKQCWEEWAEHYADGQSRDRVAFAKRQIAGETIGTAKLAIASEGTAASAAPAAALPQPTSVFAPVPMMAKPDASAVASASAAPRTPCEERCDRSIEACLGGCNSPICEGFCSQKHTRCATKCASALEAPAMKGGASRR